MLKFLKSNKGFTIIENILTVTVVALGLMGGMIVMQNATAKTVNNDMTTIATQVANEKIEAIMADKEFSGYTTIIEDNYPTEGLSDPYNFTRTTDINEVNAEDLTTSEESSGMKKVVVTVSWGDEDYHKVSVSTLVADL